VAFDGEHLDICGIERSCGEIVDDEVDAQQLASLGVVAVVGPAVAQKRSPSRLLATG
jgi:hypothetical protein